MGVDGGKEVNTSVSSKKEITKMKENNKITGSVKAIAFDADDTLWALQNYFEDVEDEYCD